jgi:hypothetical protein
MPPYTLILTQEKHISGTPQKENMKTHQTTTTGSKDFDIWVETNV